MFSGWRLMLGVTLLGCLSSQAMGQASQLVFEEPLRKTSAAASARFASRQPAAAAPAAMVVRQQTAPAAGAQRGPLDAQRFNSWFNAYRGFQARGGRLATAESGQVEMATSELTAQEVETGAGETMEFGALPSSQVRRRRPGVGRALSTGGSWFSSGSPFGIKYGYGSGFGYGGYGFDNPYGYGSRTGGGGAYGYGFGPFGSVGGQTGERLSGLITGGGGVEPGRLIGAEPGSIGAPGQIERGAVGGTFGRSGAGARRLGSSASTGGE